MDSALNDASVSAARVGGLIHDLRLVTTLRDDEVAVVPLDEVARRVAVEQPVATLVGGEQTAVMARGAPRAVERVVRELVHNVHSVMGGGPDARVWLTVRYDGDHSCLEVHDGAPGRQRCEFPVSEFLVLHEGGSLATEQRPDGNTVRLRLPRAS
jgi:hypothetical protein